MTQALYHGRYLNLCQTESGWEYCERVRATDAVMIFALTAERKVLLVEEFRPPINQSCICFPAGLSGDEGAESDLKAAQRELLEETGFIAEDWQFLFKGPSSPGLSSEAVSFYLASTLYRVTHGGGVQGENITVHEVALDEVDHWLQQKASSAIAIDPRVYTGLYFLQKAINQN